MKKLSILFALVGLSAFNAAADTASDYKAFAIADINESLTVADYSVAKEDYTLTASNFTYKTLSATYELRLAAKNDLDESLNVASYTLTKADYTVDLDLESVTVANAYNDFDLDEQSAE